MYMDVQRGKSTPFLILQDRKSIPFPILWHVESTPFLILQGRKSIPFPILWDGESTPFLRLLLKVLLFRNIVSYHLTFFLTMFSPCGPKFSFMYFRLVFNSWCLNNRREHCGVFPLRPLENIMGVCIVIISLQKPSSCLPARIPLLN